MCGRYSLFDEQDNKEIGKILAEINRKYPTHPIRTGEIFPTNTVPVLTTDGKDLSPKPLVWGFPKYTGSGVIINARAETVEEKKTFRQSLFTNRCDRARYALCQAQVFTNGTNRRKNIYSVCPVNKRCIWLGSAKNMMESRDM